MLQKVEENRRKETDEIQEAEKNLRLLKDQLKQEEGKTSFDCDEETKKLKDDQTKKQEEKKMKLKDKYTDRIAKAGTNSQSVGSLMNQYQKDLVKLQEATKKDDEHLTEILSHKLAARNEKMNMLREQAKLEESKVEQLKASKIKQAEDIVKTVEAHVNNKETQERIRIEIGAIMKPITENPFKEEIDQKIKSLNTKEEQDLIEERKKEKILDTSQYEEVKKMAEDADEKNKKLLKELEQKKSNYDLMISNSNSEKEREALIKKSREDEEAIKMKIKIESDKMLLLTRERISERKAAKREKENQIKAQYDQQRDQLEKELADQQYNLDIQKAKETVEQGLQIINNKFHSNEVPQAIDALLNYAHNQQLMVLLSHQMQEKESRLRKMIGKFINEKSIKMVKIKMDFDDTYKNLMKLRNEKDRPLSQESYDARIMDIKIKESEKMDDLEIQLVKAQGEEEEKLITEIEEVHNEQLIKLKEEFARERERLVRQASTDPYITAYYSGDQDYINRELQAYRNNLEAKLAAKTKEISEKKAKLKEISETTEVKLMLIEEAVNKKLDLYRAKEEEREEKRKREHELLTKEREEAIKKKYSDNEAKAKLMAEHQKELVAFEKATEEERKRHKEMLETLLQEKLKMKEKLRKEKEEQIALFKREQHDWKQQFMAQKLSAPAYAEMFAEESKMLVGNDLSELHKKYDAKKMLIEKPKMAHVDIEKKQIMSLVGAFESNLEKRYQEKTKAASINLLEKFDFDVLLNKITMLERTVDEFSANKFDNLKDGFRKMNKTLDELKYSE